MSYPKYICESYLIHDFKKHIAQGGIKLGVSLDSTEVFFNYQDNYELQFKLYQELKNINLPLLGESILFPKNVQSLIQHAKNLKLYDIELDDLPETTPIYKEIKEVLSLIYNQLESPLKLNDQDKVLNYNLSYPFFHYAQNNLLDIKNTNNEVKNIKVYHAQNKRQEVEACIQHIMRNNINESYIVVPSFDEYLHILEAVLKRYGLDRPLRDESIHSFKHLALSILNFFLEPSDRNFDFLLQENPLELKNIQNIIIYKEIMELNYQELLLKKMIIEDENHDLFHIEHVIQDDLEEMKKLSMLLKNIDLKDCLVFIFELTSKKYKKESLALKYYIESYQEYIKEENAMMVIEHIESFSPSHYFSENIKIIELKNLQMTPMENCFILGLSSKNFPGNIEHRGLIDEQYLSLINKYPKLNIRSKYNNNQMFKWLNLSKNLFLSYHLSDYDGKTIEPSFHIQKFAKEKNVSIEAWPIYELKNIYTERKRLSPEKAKELFLENGQIYASVSSLQKYASKPLEFFIENGLQEFKPQKPHFSMLHLGNINHSVMEGQNYNEVWKKIYPKDSLKMKLIFDRNKELLDLNFNFLESANRSTLFKPQEFERKIYSNNFIPKFKLKGYIDRIDIYEDHFLIIDYKSSLKSLDKEEFFSAKDLQLITYAYIWSKMHKQIPTAVMYFSFSNPNSVGGQLYYINTSGLHSKDNDAETEWMNRKKFKGWALTNTSNFFKNSNYWQGVVTSKRTKPKLFKQIEKALLIIYDDLFSNIINGILDEKDLEFTLNSMFDLESEDNTLD